MSVTTKIKEIITSSFDGQEFTNNEVYNITYPAMQDRDPDVTKHKHHIRSALSSLKQRGRAQMVAPGKWKLLNGNEEKPPIEEPQQEPVATQIETPPQPDEDFFENDLVMPFEPEAIKVEEIETEEPKIAAVPEMPIVSAPVKAQPPPTKRATKVMYRIRYRTRVPGYAAGHGHKLFNTLEECEERCDHFNEKTPCVIHAPERVEVPDESLGG